ncbi:SseB family protein [Lacisediminihabitans changchengi]|uniref:SseB family protein n=1 Tax=Lacisediminihabitans changchengi TaxID=2787634 RepID=A0A934SL90_9MICO|nr:SseB family protein [Lacisediminihabitans changchengi]MBK4347623.1 SseB family protein [Lacisediminihabitans changchengi]
MTASHDHHPLGAADSNGTPWAGRQFEPNQSAGDDGSAPERLIEAIRRFRATELGEAEVLDALRESRLLIPLVAQLGEAGMGDHGHVVDKSAELAIVTVAAPDGRSILPAFSSVDSMRAWNPKARPVPADAVRVALAAAGEQTDLVVLDPTSATEFVIRRPALWALAQSQPWTPSYLDPEVRGRFEQSIEPENDVEQVRLVSGDPDARLAGPELTVELALRPGLDQPSLAALLARLQERWGSDAVIATRVDSLGVTVVAA